MHFYRQARPQSLSLRAAGAALLSTGLAGCEAIDGGPGLFATVALLLVAVLAGALGSWLVHVQRQQALGHAREALRHARQLHGGWLWQTDAGHHLQAWTPTGQKPLPAGATPCTLFDADQQPLLRRQLQAGQAFQGLRLQASQPWQGSTGWRLSGAPRHDTSGAFVGFEGHASPTDAEDALQLAAAALPAALAACTEPTVLVARAPGSEDALDWRLQLMNSAAQELWPAATAGGPLAPLLQATPQVLAALQALPDPGVCIPVQLLQGWRITPISGTGSAGQSALLSRLPAITPLAAPAAASPAAADPEDAEGDTFSFTLTHDLRAPIRVVEGFTRIVKEDYGRHLDRVGNDHLDRVLGAAARMNLMIDALLTLARLSRQPLAHQRVNLSQLAGFIVDDLRRSAPERSAEIDIEAQLTAWGDPTLLRLVLENLLGNAWKYTGRCPHAQISLRTVNQGGRAAFVVRDNGAGFDMRSADRLFGLFQRLHSASDFPGHGVGLASVRRIVRRHGGDIWAEAEPGRGAAFYFTLAA